MNRRKRCVCLSFLGCVWSDPLRMQQVPSRWHWWHLSNSQNPHAENASCIFEHRSHIDNPTSRFYGIPRIFKNRTTLHLQSGISVIYHASLVRTSPNECSNDAVEMCPVQQIKGSEPPNGWRLHAPLSYLSKASLSASSLRATAFMCCP